MSTFVTYRDGGKTNEEGLFKQLTRLFTKGNPTNYSSTSMQVVQRAAGANMSVDISIGDVHLPIPSANYSYWGWTDTATNAVVAASDPTNPRIDVVYAWVDTTVVSSVSNNNPGALKFGISAGTPSATPSANSDATIQTALGSSVPFVRLATVRVGNGVGNITTSVITDARTTIQSLTTSSISTTNTGWSPINFAATYGGNTGSKEFTVTYPTDLTGVLSPGMKHQVTRTTTAPTQCMAFTAASSQYALNTTPSGITFTAAITLESWVYLNSYTASSIVSKTSNGQDGFYLILTSTGQLQLNAGSSSGNYRSRASNPIVPLKRWVHVAAVITQSSGSAAIYINGSSVPFSTNDAGTSTSITQAGNLYVGRYADTAAGYFDGYLSETRIWSSAQSQAQIQANMAISLTGSETNLVALFQGNGNFNDKTANANNLTASGGAIATQATNPYNNIEYGFITKVSYSAPNTTVTIFTGTDCNIPNQALSSPQYSTARAPFGFPSATGKWTLISIYKNQFTQSSAAASTWYNLGQQQLSVPIGEWEVGYSTSLVSSATGSIILYQTIAPVNNAETDVTFTTEAYNSGSSTFGVPRTRYRPYTQAAQSPLYLNSMQVGGSGSTLFNIDNGVSIIEAKCAYV